ncbi:MAG TPA: SDR family NAD(P)-dependent oxidoreductase [Steroidobacteraceae bacterium]|nr:SDR family NAD(P)-dependent oxidoreductase [Steroidobacteraceae bacterium]
MSCIFITGSTDGLGLAAARELMDKGHQVVLHARSAQRTSALADVAHRGAGIVIGDLSSAKQTRALAEQVNKLGRMDAIIHNAAAFQEPSRLPTPEGHAKTLAVNVLAPYMLTALIERPHRLIYLSSGTHGNGKAPLTDIDWVERRWDPSASYAESKFFITALAMAVARLWPYVLSNAVDPGWVPTKMGGPRAPDDLVKGHLTQTWLAVSDEAEAKVSGKYWHHRKQLKPAAQTLDTKFQDQLVAMLSEMTGVSIV